MADDHSISAGGLTREQAREVALAGGFQEAGLVALPYAAEGRDAERFREWVSAGRAGTMGYLRRRAEDGRFLREREAVAFPWARSAVVCFASYHSRAPLSTDAAPEGAGWIARYAWTSHVLPGRRDERRPSDYHKVLLKRIRRVEMALHEQLGEFESRAYVDTGPVVERALAAAAGVGWIGKNTCVIHPKLGSFGFLAVLLTSLEVDESAGERVSESASQRISRPGGEEASAVNPNFDKEQPQILRLRPPGRTPLSMTKQLISDSQTQDASTRRAGTGLELPDRCGSCRRCIEACPTDALIAPYQMDATLCISYLTIEHKGPIAEELMEGMGRQVFGCDICQDVCPWNRKAPIAADAELEPRAELINPALECLGSLDEAAFERQFNGSPVRRAGFPALKRNVAIAMGNSGLTRFVPMLEEWATTADEGLRSAARWALEKLRRE